MNLVKGDLWQEVNRANLILFASNSTLDLRGRLVMGAGSALEAKRLRPDLPKQIGKFLSNAGLSGGDFLCWFPPSIWTSTETAIGALQTKRDWREKSDLKLIGASIERFSLYLSQMPRIKRVAMSFPGIGHGQLLREDVLPLLEVLPDSVVVYERT